MKLTEREPVALSGLVSGLAAAVMGVLVAFNVWNPTDDQTAAVYALLAALIAVTTTLARGKAWAPASVTRALDENSAAVTELADARQRAAVAEARLPQPVDVEASLSAATTTQLATLGPAKLIAALHERTIHTPGTD